LRRFATKDEIADLAVFLSSDGARFITGAVVVCDGGQSLAGLGVNIAAATKQRA
jgi:NAD(P)-dependent dehydrogenase (short-subunit alcohol dehydrogenase family)